MEYKLDKMLRVNLTEGDVEFEKIERDALQFIGGKGLAAHYLLRELKA